MPKRPGAPKRAAEFLERLLPETDEQSGTAFADRQTRRQTAHKMGITFDRAIQAFDRLEESLDKEEEGEDFKRRRWDDRRSRRESDESARERAETRADIRQGVWVEERQRAMRQRDVLLALSVVTTLAAIALAYLAVKHSQIEYVGAAMFSTVLSGVEVLFMRGLGGSQEAAEVGQTPVEPPPFRWSALDLQREFQEAGGWDDGEDPAG